MRYSSAPLKKARTFDLMGAIFVAALATATPVSAQPAADRLSAIAETAVMRALQEGAAHAAAGRWEDARRAFGDACAWNPDLAVAHYNHGVALGALGQSDDAIAAYQRALAVTPTLAEAIVNIGVELFKSGRAAAALPYLEHAVRLAPRLADARHNLGVVLASLGRFDDAVAALEVAAQIDPALLATRRALADTHASIGMRAAARQQWAEALASYRRALDYDGDLPEAFNGAGVALSRLRDDHAAVAMFHEALRRRPRFADARYNLASALVTLGRYREAMAACRAALRVQPTLLPAVQLLDELQRRLMPAARSTVG
jgi:tetratricopeptide (TPR) repeat protein